MSKYKFEKILISDISLDNKKVFIWGTGNTSELYQEGLKRIEDRLNITGYGDNDKDKQGTLFHGKMVYSAEQIAEYEDAIVLIASPQKCVSDAVSEQLNVMSVENHIIDRVIFSLYSEELHKAIELLTDEYSKELYSELIYCRATNNEPDVRYVSGNTYFAMPSFCRRNTKEIFVDCGAYVGDTVEDYLWNREGAFSKIIAIEPDAGNYKAMQKRVERLKAEWNLKDDEIVMYPYGVGDKDEIIYVSSYNENHGLGSKILSDRQEDMVESRIVKLDSLLSDNIGYIKADIESYEYKMLCGAKRVITEYKPMLAVCIYHNSMDFFQIINLIHEYNSEYKFAVRHHLYDLSETVLYAWI